MSKKLWVCRNLSGESCALVNREPFFDERGIIRAERTRTEFIINIKRLEELFGITLNHGEKKMIEIGEVRG